MSLPFNSLWISGLAGIILLSFFVYFFLYPLKIIDFICDLLERRKEKKTRGNIEQSEIQSNLSLERKRKNTMTSSIIYNADHYFNNTAFENDEEYNAGFSTSNIPGNPEEHETDTFIPDNDRPSIDMSKKIMDAPEISEDDVSELGGEEGKEIQLKDL